MNPQHRQGAQMVTFGPEWTVTPRVAAGLLGIEHRQVVRLIEDGVLPVQHEGRNRLIELDSLFAYRHRKSGPRQHPATHPADPDKDQEHRHDH
ncbi:helix-turn-helix domain-containing protein [Streptomyces sp. 4503]|uniref:Helix-turn-helix domain-containing protein n=1 Tax=Streptomyces niphimycinicus TaxID=2842201 RepID=A0ABS6CF92_9ACTN|nr:helix-turn-helix domain-containing protein [Streptomyces niphimycinicus]MBU3865547.1 helix-turn-helix domain-containing protein [Streptomyces niphimycinicus]